MDASIILTLVATTLATVHFGAPLAYYVYLRRKWLSRPWSLKTDPSYTPKITIIVPAYNEAELIKEKLDNIYMQEYPRDKMEVIVVDSASIDGTPRLVREWAREHPDLRLKLVEEPVRRGKAHALNNALKAISEDAEIVAVTDVDSFWPHRDTLRRAMSYFSDPSVGAVSCLKRPADKGPAGVEEGYRDYYNLVRLAESKAYSTPVFHGELAAYRKKLLEEIGGFPEYLGADDSHTATMITLRGRRTITPENIWCTELVPRENYTLWRIRRAQHLTQHFLKTLRTGHKTPRQFKKILLMEIYLHIFNPWLLLVAAIILVMSSVMGSPLAVALLALGTALLAYKPYRTWITTQLYLIVAMIKNLYTREITWRKLVK